MGTPKSIFRVPIYAELHRLSALSECHEKYNRSEICRYRDARKEAMLS